MKFSIITFVIFLFLSFVSNTILADPPAPIEMADGFSYEFGEFGEGLMKVYKDSELVYDFGDQPVWFTLVYMHQYIESGNLVTKSKYFYPKAADSEFTNCYDLFIYPDSNLSHVTYKFKFNELDDTEVWLYFKIYANYDDDNTRNGVKVSFNVFNKKEDDSPTSIWRLMEVHCPFVRFPSIDSSAPENDRLALGTMLIENPITFLAAEAEPWPLNADGTAINRHGEMYPSGIQMFAFYGDSENTGKGPGVCCSLINPSQKSCEFGVFKHNKQDYHDWFWIKDDNRYWPSDISDRYNIVWDVVNYPNPDLDYSEIPYSQGSSIFHLRFSEEMDWYDAAKWRKAELKYMDEYYASDKGIRDSGTDDLYSVWPDYTLKESPYIPNSAKLNALMLYISPQENGYRHSFSGASGRCPVADRVKAYESYLHAQLNFETDWPNADYRIFASTWIPDYARDNTTEGGLYSRRELYWNHPEWTLGYLPIDAAMSDPGYCSWKEKFYRDDLDELIAQLDDDDNNIQCKFFSHIGSYNMHLDDEIQFNDELGSFSTEFFRISLYENPDFTRLSDYMHNSIAEVNWGADCTGNFGFQDNGYEPLGYVSYSRPFIGACNLRYYKADIRTFEAYYASKFNDLLEYDLDAGLTDSQFLYQEHYGQNRYLGAGGIYGGVNFWHGPTYNNMTSLYTDDDMTLYSRIYSVMPNWEEIPPGSL